MPMRVTVTVNNTVVGEAEIINITGNPTKRRIHLYRWTYQGENNRTLAATLQHKQADGAIVLASKVLASIALRYRIAGKVQRDA